MLLTPTIPIIRHYTHTATNQLLILRLEKSVLIGMNVKNILRKTEKANKVWNEIFKPQCFGKFPWDRDAQLSGRCPHCKYLKECFKVIKGKAAKNYLDAVKSKSVPLILSRGVEAKVEQLRLEEVERNSRSQ